MPYIRRLTFVDFCDITGQVPYVAEQWIDNYAHDGFFPEGWKWHGYWRGFVRRYMPHPYKQGEQCLDILPSLLWETLRYHDLVNAHFYGGDLESRAIAAGFPPEGAKLVLVK